MFTMSQEKKTCTLHFFLVICSSKTLAVKHLVEKFSSLTWRYNYRKRVTGNKDLCTFECTKTARSKQQL